MTLRCKQEPRPPPGSTKPCSDRVGGFTLIELLVSLAILGLALVLIAGYKPPWSRGVGLRATAAELATGLRLARSEAILSNRVVVFDIDLTGHRYRVGKGTPRRSGRRAALAWPGRWLRPGCFRCGQSISCSSAKRRRSSRPWR